jgi:DNA-binding NarL/FixJ family response regulator
VAGLSVFAIAESAAGAELLVNGLEHCYRLHVLGVIAADSGARVAGLGERPHVAVVEVGRVDSGNLARIGELAALAIPVVAVMPDMERSAEAWDAGARGLVLAGAADAWQAVIEVVAGGGVAITPDKIAAIYFLDPLAELPSSALTTREIEVLRLVAGGHSNAEIAHMLGITLSGVKYHVRMSCDKLAVQGRWAAVVAAIRSGALTQRR